MAAYYCSREAVAELAAAERAVLRACGHRAGAPTATAWLASDGARLARRAAALALEAGDGAAGAARAAAAARRVADAAGGLAAAAALADPALSAAVPARTLSAALMCWSSMALGGCVPPAEVMAAAGQLGNGPAVVAALRAVARVREASDCAARCVVGGAAAAAAEAAAAAAAQRCCA